jgi:hypothetical protein
VLVHLVERDDQLGMTPHAALQAAPAVG